MITLTGDLGMMSLPEVMVEMILSAATAMTFLSFPPMEEVTGCTILKLVLTKLG